MTYISSFIYRVVRLAKVMGCDIFIYMKPKSGKSGFSCSTGNLDFHDCVSEALDQQDCIAIDNMMKEADLELKHAMDELNREWKEKQ